MPLSGHGSIPTPRRQASVMGAAELVLKVVSTLRSEAEMLRLESISRDGPLPRPKKNTLKAP